MSKRNDDECAVDRRNFLKVIGVASVSTTIPGVAIAAETTAMGHGHAAPALGSRPGYVFLNLDEGGFIEAAIDVLIPSDSTGPGAVESGVVIYIDRQLGGAYGSGARLYLQGPFQEGEPEQGYQLPFTPAELIKAGIADVDAYALEKHQKNFAALSVGDRDAILKELDEGKATLATVPAKIFFGHLWSLTQEGYFGDPIHGGNTDKAVWKMIGFPGVGNIYTDAILEYRNKPYPVEPQSIQDFS